MASLSVCTSLGGLSWIPEWPRWEAVLGSKFWLLMTVVWESGPLNVPANSGSRPEPLEISMAWVRRALCAPVKSVTSLGPLL